MPDVIAILAGAFLSGVSSLCIGSILLGGLKVKLERVEYVSIAFVVGSACFSQIILALLSTRLAYKGVFLTLGILAVGFSLALNRRIRPTLSPTPLPRRWIVFSTALFAPFAVVYLVNALAPEMSPDGAAYHLPLIAHYLRVHGFERIPDDFYASLSQGIELLFLPAVSLGGHSSAALVHFLFLLNLPVLMICYGRRFGFPIPAAAAAFLVFASPVAGWDGTSAYVDVAAAAVMFAVFYLLQVWESGRHANLLIPIGILAGFSYAAKYTGAIAVPYALGFVGWKLWRKRESLLRPLLTVAVCAAIFIVPWMVKNALLTGNPLAPFENRLFPNGYVHISFEREYTTYLRHYHLTNWLKAPWELTVKGERLQGFFGPVFLLMPLAVVSLRRSAGRRLLCAGAIFALPWFLNIGSRFLIPALPSLALALALALERPAWLLTAAMILHGFLSWYAPPVRYFDRYAPRIAAVPVRAALRMENEAAYLARRAPGYRIDRMIERKVLASNQVFSFEPIPEAWTTREIVAAKNGAENEVLGDILRTALVSDACPVHAVEFHFPPAQLRGIRATLTARFPGEMWSVSEFRIFAGGRLLAPDRKWRMRANPNPWDAALAFDGSQVTRWRSWEDSAPGMFLEVNFGEPQLVDHISLMSSPDDAERHINLFGMDGAGVWRALPLRPPISRTCPPAGNLRREAVRQVLSRGVRYLLVTPTAFGANDFAERAAAWGIQPSGETDGARLYLLDPDHTPPEARPPVMASGPPASAVGVYDDADPRIQLRQPWTHDTQFQEAYGHTLTYSDVPGASMALSFTGRSITYIFTGAWNRGIAEVRIDGRVKELLDLYASHAAWQTKRRYEGLDEGDHLIEIRVSGNRNPRATGSFVDLDALIVE